MNDEERVFTEKIMLETQNQEALNDLYKVRLLMSELVLSVMPFEKSIEEVNSEESRRLLGAYRAALAYKVPGER